FSWAPRPGQTGTFSIKVEPEPAGLSLEQSVWHTRRTSNLKQTVQRTQDRKFSLRGPRQKMNDCKKRRSGCQVNRATTIWPLILLPAEPQTEWEILYANSRKCTRRSQLRK